MTTGEDMKELTELIVTLEVQGRQGLAAKLRLGHYAENYIEQLIKDDPVIKRVWETVLVLVDDTLLPDERELWTSPAGADLREYERHLRLLPTAHMPPGGPLERDDK